MRYLDAALMRSDRGLLAAGDESPRSGRPCERRMRSVHLGNLPRSTSLGCRPFGSPLVIPGEQTRV